MKREKKKATITGKKVLGIIGVLAILSGLGFVIVELVRGTPPLEIFTENPFMWIGIVIPILVIFFLFGDEKQEGDEK